MHEPRFRFGHGFGMAVSPNGPDHMTSIYDDGYTQEGLRDIEQLRFFEEVHPYPMDDLSQGKIKLLFLHSNWQHFLDCAMLCHFLPYDPKQVTDLVNAITGWRTDPNENLRAGERFITLARVFNLREGLTDREDTLPDRFFQPFKTGPLNGKAPSREEFRKAKTMYYELNGWTGDKGIPTTQRLKDLGLEWAAEELVAS